MCQTLVAPKALLQILLEVAPLSFQTLFGIEAVCETTFPRPSIHRVHQGCGARRQEEEEPEALPEALEARELEDSHFDVNLEASH